MTIADFARRIQVQLKQAFDDREIPLTLIVGWVGYWMNRLLAQRLNKNECGTGEFMQSFIVDVQYDDERCERGYITLPADTLSVKCTGGIDYATYTEEDCDKLCLPMYARRNFFLASPREVRLLAANPDTKPSAENPVMVREGNKLWLLGIQPGIEQIEIGIILAFPFDPTTANGDQEINFPDDLMPLLEMHVLEMGRFMWALPKQDQINDGSPRSGRNEPPMNTPARVSVNNPTMIPDMQ